MSTAPSSEPSRWQPTGSNLPISRKVRLALGEYEVQLEVSQDGGLLGVTEVSVSRDFRSQRQRIDARGFHDVLDIYEAES